MARDRRSGILLHPTSLPGAGGAGDLGAEAHRFARWLSQAGQRLWQVLPLGPAGYGDSPYQGLSAFAGNPLLVSLEALRDEGLLEASGLEPARYAGRKWAEGAGCEQCNGTGYRGRAAITEFLDLSAHVRKMILDRRPAADLQTAATADGMVTLRQSALAKALAGETTLKEINRVTFVD